MKVHILYDGIIWMQGRAELRTLYIFADKLYNARKSVGFVKRLRIRYGVYAVPGKQIFIHLSATDMSVDGHVCRCFLFYLKIS